ncbi:MAG: isoaspartyl peptidase/L-asparaginase [Actinomycetota bacterium]|nr:isoaspartyl peptidase/L-asparaginase [Actinomycetota bacterium]
MANELRAIAVHGGAGNRIPRERSQILSIHGALEAAIAAADGALDAGGSALDAVEAAVVVLEDAPHFNAGRGSVPTAAGTVEMDAGIMCGGTLRAGAVALVSSPRNPIAAARLVLEDGAHLLLAGAGADDFAGQRGARLEQPDYFLVRRRGDSHVEQSQRPAEHGTVGAVVSDGCGNLAAGTSTGGTRGQLPGRIGDSPIVGAGVYAENRSCAVSCTGSGEEIMRTLLAHRIARAVERQGSPSSACEQAVRGALSEAGGSGGAIALDAQGNLGVCFTTAVMHRAWKLGGARPRAAST